MNLTHIRASIIGENAVREFDFLISNHTRMIGLPQEDIDALGLYNVRVEESTASPTYMAKGMLESKYVDARAVATGVPFVTYAGPTDIPRISYWLLRHLKGTIQCHGKTWAGMRCRRSIEIVQTKTCHTHRNQSDNLQTWQETRRKNVSHISLAATPCQGGVVGCAATRATPLRDHETTYGAVKSTPYFAQLVAAARTMESIKPGPIVFHINDKVLRWHIERFKETPTTHPAWHRFWDAAQPHEIQVRSRNAENKATVYATEAAHDALIGYQAGDSTLYDPRDYEPKSAIRRRTAVTEHSSEGVILPTPFATHQREEEIMFGHLIDRICLICNESSHSDICADCTSWG